VKVSLGGAMPKLVVLANLVIRAFLAVAMAALFLMMMTIVVDVFMRYAFNAPVVGAFDVVEICLVVAVFYSMGAAIFGFHEIVIDIVDQIASPKAVALLTRLAGLLSAAVLLFIFVSMLTPAMQSYQYGEIRLELKIPVWTIWAIALLGMCGGLLASVLNILRPFGASETEPLSRSKAS
jgi:TRAP-type C4-dicarboxylate transport system permease small subunit